MKEVDVIFSVGGILHNQILLAALLAWAVSQFFKIITFALVSRELNFRRLVETGGMPSSHTALVSALATGVGLQQGFESSSFALAVIFALVVMYDAAGVRRAAGKQAQVLNAIIEDLYRKQLHPERLRELLGHTPFEVLVGAILGILIAIWRL